MAEFRMPSLGATMEAGTLVEWKIKPGDHVEHGDIVAVVETDKAALDVEIFAGGEIEELLVGPGEKVPVGTVLARIRDGEVAQSPGPESRAPVPTAPPPPSEAPSVPPAALPQAPPAIAPMPAPPSAKARARISPAARKRARELNVDPASLVGSGPHGAVTLADVEALVAGPRAVSEGRRMHVMQALGAAMAKSKREIPHYYLTSEIEVGSAQEWLQAENARLPPGQRLLFAALLYKAVARALVEVPELNGYFRDGAFTSQRAIHLGIAISLRHGGTVAPAIHDVDKLSVHALMSALSDLTLRTRAGSLRSSELADSTVTVTSLGDNGPDAVIGVIYPPQVAIIGFGATRSRPWVVDGAVAVRPVITASLSADHRASEGRQGARFLERLARYLSQPEQL